MFDLLPSPKIAMDSSDAHALAFPNLTKRKIPNLLEDITAALQNTRKPLYRLHQVIIAHATLQFLHEPVLRHLRLHLALRDIFSPDMELPEPLSKSTTYGPSQRRTNSVAPYRGEIGFEVLCRGQVFLDLRVRRDTEVVKTGCFKLDCQGIPAIVLYDRLDARREGL